MTDVDREIVNDRGSSEPFFRLRVCHKIILNRDKAIYIEPSCLHIWLLTSMINSKYKYDYEKI